MTKEFKTPDEFANFLKENETVKSILPFAEELIALTDGIGNGCACRKNQRIANRDHVYKTMLQNILSVNTELQDTIKKYGGFDNAVWKLNDLILLEI
jgi:hypothetical protein